MIIKLL